MPDTYWILVATMATVGAVAAGATALSHPRISLGILFLLASFSRSTLETPLGTMRPEMPAIAVVALVLLASGRFSALRSVPRAAVAMALAFGTYLVVLAISSAFVAPGTAQSLRMVAWLAISMTGGVVTFVLVRPRPVDAIEPLAFAGAVMGAFAIVFAALFLIAGPEFNFGIQDPHEIVPRVFAFGWETNLYASFMAMCVFFAFEAARGPRRATGLAMLALVLIAFPLGITRGAYLGLAAGIIAYVAARIAAERRPRALPSLGAVSAALLLVGLAASNVLLPNALEREGIGGLPSVSPGPSVSQSEAEEPSPTPSRSESQEPTPTIGPTPSLEAYPDTVGFRLERVPIALADLRHSPLIGFGAESFGQRHPERYAGPGPDHIAIMAVVVPYEAGLIGAAGLLIGFVLLLYILWRSARRSGARGDWRSVGAAAAFIGSIVTVLVAYQVTNALHLAINWIVIGAAAALTVREATRDSASDARA
jgi:hypothetical protein